MKKRLLSLLCVLAFALPFIAATPCFADTGETTIDQITYRYDTETGEATVNDADESISGNAVIPGTIEVGGQKYKVTSVGDYAFFYCSRLMEITIPEGVTSIREHAFAYCSSLKEITIPEGVTSIGNSAFISCDSLIEITIPGSVASIGDYAFAYCSNLKEITIPEDVISIRNGAFFNCTGLTEVYMKEGLILGADSFLNVSRDVHVWRYEVLEGAEVSEDGKVHVAIVSVKGKDGTDITASLTISDGAMGDGYVIDEVKLSNLTLKHTLTETEATPATCTESGNVEYWTCDTCGKHFIDENGTEEIEESEWIIPAAGHSYGDDGHCMACGAVDSDFAPAIIAGANATWQKGSEDGLSFTSNAAFADFLKVQVDGKDVDASNYTVKEGSTIVTLKTSYLETLPAGKHTLAIVSDTGTAETEFTVVAAEKQVVDDESANDKAASDSDKESLAKTSDGSILPITVLSILAVTSIATGVFALRRSRI